MNVVVAMDSFKGTMSAREACERVRAGILEVVPDANVMLCPMADGGEGTAKALMAARGGEWMPCRVTGPLQDQQIDAGYAWFPDDQTALVEMASASGITLLDPTQLNPLRTTTFGTGELIQAAIARGTKRLILAVGGSATVDGGVGAAQAMGWRFLDRQGEPIGLGGAALWDIHTIQPPPKPSDIPVQVLCDVTNPLTGPKGAAAVFGPQKGATPDMVQQLDVALKHLADCVQQQLGVDIDTVSGAGAAGGLAAGAIAFMGAKLTPGIDTVMDAARLADRIANADWVISGEGRFDSQSLHGKVVSGIQRLASEHHVQVGVIAGSVKVNEAEVQAAGLVFAWRTASEDTPLADALKTAKEDLQKTARRFAETYRV